MNNFSGEMSHITNFAFNAWWAVFRPHLSVAGLTSAFDITDIRLSGSPDSSEKFSGMQLGTWAIAIFAVLLIPIIITLFHSNKRALNSRLLFTVMGCVTLLGFVLLPKMHERYMYPFFPLFLVSLGFGVPVLYEYATLLILNLINLYFVWHPVPLAFIPVSLIISRNAQWGVSIATVLMACSVYRKVLKYLSQP
jgi:hypothetical protein